MVYLLLMKAIPFPWGGGGGGGCPFRSPLGGGGGVTPCDDLYGEAPPEWGILGLHHHQNHTNIGKTKFFHPVVFAAKVVYNNINNNNYNYNNNN